MASPERIAADKLISREILAAGLLPGTARGKIPAFRVTTASGAKVCVVHVASWDLVDNPVHEASIPKVAAAFAESGTRNVVVLYHRPSLDESLAKYKVDEICRVTASRLGRGVRACFIGNPLTDEAGAAAALRALIAELAPKSASK